MGVGTCPHALGLGHFWGYTPLGSHMIKDPYIQLGSQGAQYALCTTWGLSMEQSCTTDIGTSPFTPRCFMAAACEWESMKQMLQIARYTTILETSRRPV